MKLLTAIFSYNRYYLLKNAVESFFEFGPEGDLFIADDGSDDPRIVEYLKQIREQGRAEVFVNSRRANDYHGGYYANKDRAAEYGIANGYSHIFFVEEDAQFMWRDPDFTARMERVFSMCPDASMVLPIFHKGIMRHMFHKRLELNEAAQAWHLKPYGLIGQGIMPLSLVQKHKWQFREEGSAGNIWREWGYKIYVTPAPTFAFVPWPEVRRYNKKVGTEKKLARKYFLKPLDEAQIKTLNSMGTAQIPYLEDFCFPWGWRCWSPYWFRQRSIEYYKILLQGYLSGRGQPLRIVGVK